MKFHVVMVVWGASYIETMVDVTIPTLLSPGNIPALAQMPASDVTFYTRVEDEKLIRKAPSVQSLARLIDVRYAHIDPTVEATIYVAMSKAHSAAAHRAQAEGAHAIILAPDILVADGSLASVVRLAVVGKRAVMTIGPRLTQESALPALRTCLAGDDGGILRLAPRQMVRFALDHLHRETKRTFFDSPEFSLYPTTCLWAMPGRGFLARNFHLHPLMIDFSKTGCLSALRRDTIDGDFIGHAVGRWQDIHVETDSDNILLCSLSPAGATYSPTSPNLASADQLRAMAYSAVVNPLHRMFFMQAVRVHAEDIDEDWHLLEEETGLWAFEMLKWEPVKGGPSPSSPALRRRGIAYRLTRKWQKIRRKIQSMSG
ncbi:hypothetical protein ACMDCR_11735 [Labrys okinawensis]|uniref:hypothetical protein n=1 Tax=Labrys okinawensis TaxID=346911 RepID=UPI0039BC274F